MTKNYADLSERSRLSIDTLTLHLLNCPIAQARESALHQFEAAMAEGYERGEGLSPERSAAMAKQWIGIVRERVQAAEALGRMPLSNERPNA